MTRRDVGGQVGGGRGRVPGPEAVGGVRGGGRPAHHRRDTGETWIIFGHALPAWIFAQNVSSNTREGGLRISGEIQARFGGSGGCGRGSASGAWGVRARSRGLIARHSEAQTSKAANCSLLFRTRRCVYWGCKSFPALPCRGRAGRGPAC